MALDQQTQALMKQMQAGGFKPASQIPVEQSRAGLTQMATALALPKVEVYATEDRIIAGPDAEFAIRIYQPGPKPDLQKAGGELRAAALYFHGGGFYLGDLETHDHVCRAICRQSGLTIVAVDYRLAPEHKFPAAVDDCYAALCWLAEQGADIGVDPDRIALVGDSAGGSLVVSCCLLAKQRGGPKVSFQVVVYPALSLTDGEEFPSRAELGTGEYFMAIGDFAFFRELYLHDPEKEVRDPLVSPIYAEDYRGLPPALVVTAGYDPCVDENRHYAERLQQDGVPVTYKCFENTIHPFFLFDGVIDAGKEGQKLVADTLKDFFGGEGMTAVS